MLAHLITPALVLLAGTVHAQSQTPSVVTFISISPVPTTEGVYTVQTSVPGMSASSCYEVCIMEPCFPCGVSSVGGSMGIPAGETPLPSSMGIPAGETPIPSSLVSQSIYTNPLRTSITPNATRSQPSRSSSQPPQQSTAAASSLDSNGPPFVFALAASGLTLFGAAVALL